MKRASAKILVGIVLISTFGPYLGGGVRTEQIAVYVFGTLFFLLQFKRIDPAVWRSARGVLVSWFGYMTVLLAATALALVSPPDVPGLLLNQGSILAGLDGILVPMVLMLFIVCMASRSEPRQVLSFACRMTVILSAFNACMAALQAFADVRFDRWWSQTGSDSTAILAASNGRYGGLFNQPAEAGLLYAACVLVSVYLLRTNRLLAVLGIFAGLVGGLLAVSKVLLMIGIPLMVWQLTRESAGRLARVAILFTGLGGGALLVQYTGLPNWPGAGQLQQVINSLGENMVVGATAGRLGENATLTQTVVPVLSLSPILGLGLAGLSLPFDNAWVEAFVYGGALGALALTFVLLTLLRSAFRAFETREGHFLQAMAVLAPLAAVGLPALTANRASSVYWILTTLLLACSYQRSDRPPAPAALAQQAVDDSRR